MTKQKFLHSLEFQKMKSTAILGHAYVQNMGKLLTFDRKVVETQFLKFQTTYTGIFVWS